MQKWEFNFCLELQFYSLQELAERLTAADVQVKLHTLDTPLSVDSLDVDERYKSTKPCSRPHHLYHWDTIPGVQHHMKQ